MSVTLYLLHFDKPYPNKTSGDKLHYLGYTTLSLSERMDRHRDGRGASLLRALQGIGGDWVIAKTWTFKTATEAQAEERRLKSHKRGYRRWCPKCRRTE